MPTFRGIGYKSKVSLGAVLWPKSKNTRRRNFVGCHRTSKLDI
jgi:hypothetical protein